LQALAIKGRDKKGVIKIKFILNFTSNSFSFLISDFVNFINDQKNQLEIVVTLLALLELMKRKRIMVIQKNQFDEIRISLEK